MEDKTLDILLVEDNPHDIELALHALRNHNLANRIEVVRDGVEALDFLFCTGAYAHRELEDHPQLVLLDVKLPKVSGLEVLDRIKSDPRTQTIPVVMLTSSRQDRNILRSYQLSVNSYIVKPVDFDQFHEAVRQLGLYWLVTNQPVIR